MKQLNEIVAHFHTEGSVAEIVPLGAGLINDTDKVATPKPMHLTTFCNESITPYSKMWKCYRPILRL